MSLLGFLTGVGSLFGGTSGKKDSTSGTTTGSKTGTINQTTGTTSANKQNTKDVAVGTSRQTSKGSDVQTSSQQSSTQQSGQSATTTGQTGRTTNYSADVLASLDSLLGGQLASGQMEQAGGAVSDRLSQVSDSANQPGFDVENYVTGIATSAASQFQGDLDSRINTILSQSGGSETGNSMAALLGGRLRNEAVANLAGVVSNASATGEQIRQTQQDSFTNQISGLSNDLGSQLINLLNVAGGAQQETQQAGTSNTVDSAQQTSQQTGKTVDITKQSTVGKEVQKQNQTVKGNESGVQSVQQTANETSNSTANGNTTSGGSGISGFFDNLLKSLGNSSAAA
jgi:hypothetical protein